MSAQAIARARPEIATRTRGQPLLALCALVRDPEPTAISEPIDVAEYV
jgi:hypothetical protein